MWNNRDIPHRFRQYRLDAYDPKTVAMLRERFVEDDGCWCLYLWGETGSRKTSLAVALLLDVRRRQGYSNRFGHFAPAYQVVDRLRDIGNETARRAIENWRRSRWLILDDLCKHRDTPHVIEQLLFLLHRRYDDCQPGQQKTVITSNIGLDDLARVIDPATARRIAEGLVIDLHLPGESQ